MLEYAARYGLSWLGVILLAWCLRYFARDPWHKAIGFALMTWPLWLSCWGFVNTIEFVLNPNSEFRAYTEFELTNIATRGLARKVGYVAAGAIIYTKAWNAESFGDIKTRLPKIPMGAWTKTEATSAIAGILIFPFLLAVTIGLNWILYQTPALANGNEENVWMNMTVLLNLGISFQAGFGEELLYRAVLLIGLMRFLPIWAAVAIQALIFGIAHGGYGTWAHILLPAGFAVFAGIAVWYTGFWSIVVVHFLIDVYAFSADMHNHHFDVVLEAALVVMGAASLAFVAHKAQKMVAKRTGN